MRGGRDFEGWSIETQILAAIYDSIALQTEVTGHWKDKPPKLPTFPRPGAEGAAKPEPAPKKPRSVADLFRAFAG